MGTPIDFEEAAFADGQVADGADIVANNALINTYLGTTKVANAYLQSKYNTICISFSMGEDETSVAGNIATGAYVVRGFKVPASFATGGLQHVETSIFRTGASGQLDVTIHDAYSEATGDTDAKISLQIANGSAAGTIDTDDASVSFNAAASIFVRAEATTNPVSGAHVTMWFKAEHRS